MKKEVIVGALVFLILLIARGTWAADETSFPISKEQVRELLDNPGVTIIDVRFGRDWFDSPTKIKGAIRENPMRPGTWLDKYPKDRMLVLY